MKKLTHEEWLLLNKQDERTLAEWWCMFNRWGWVEEFDPPEDKKDHKDGRRIAIIETIEQLVSEKLISRIWNKDMSDEEFADWWNNNKTPDQNVRNSWFEKRCEADL